jgi:hypothetical protein
VTSREQRILQMASECADLPSLSDCTAESLRDLATRRGIDFATALVYDRVLRSPRHGPFIQRVTTLTSSNTALPAESIRIAIVPGAFHKRFPASGADGRFVRDAAATMGCRADIVPLPDFSSLDDNARDINRWLIDHATPETSLVLVSLSKGGSDIKLAFRRHDAASAFASVTTWINLSGILDGTPLAGWLFAPRLRSWWTRLLLQWRGYNLDIIRHLDRAHDAPLSKPLALPEHLRAIHVVGFPLREHAANRMARRHHNRLAHLGPNDGAGILLGDAVHWPGQLYPVWGADHYLRPARQDMIRVASAMLREAVSNGSSRCVTCA